MNGIVIRLSISGMTDYNEYDALGELFRQRLENHRMSVDGNGWNKIKRRLGKQKNKAMIWLWRIGAVAAAASVAALVIFNRTPEHTDVKVVSQQITPQETGTAHRETIPVATKPESDALAQANRAKDEFHAAQFQQKETENQTTVPFFTDLAENFAEGSAVQDWLIEDDTPEVAQMVKEIPKLDISLFEDLFEDDETDAKRTGKWLLAAAFGTGGGNNSFNMNTDMHNPLAPSMFPEMGLSGSDNKYAANMSGSIRPFHEMNRNEFSNINHRPPFSFGLTARKSLGKYVGVESGLIYTCLSSQYKWSGYDVHQSLHYVGIPVNMSVYLWHANPNWRIYLSGGAMAEKGLRGIYRQEMRMGNEHRTTTVKRSAIDGMQWSLNGALGVIYRLEKGFGIYLEPRVGYSFDCNQPVSIRTEWPVYFGINVGLNYEL